MEFVVGCEAGKDKLYQDFATVWTIDPQVHVHRDAQHAIVNRIKLRKQGYQNFCNRKAGTSVRCITVHDLPVDWSGSAPPTARHAAFKSYRDEDGERNGTFVIHARKTVRNSDRNWMQSKWDELVTKLLAAGHGVLSVGSTEGASHIHGTFDRRDVPLTELAKDLSQSTAIIGPSSGPLAFAMLCETPVLWWGPNEKDGPRFRRAWNPFDVKTCHIASSWDPDVDQVEAACRRF